MPYITGLKRKAPLGVVRSPSCLSCEMPRWPTHALQGPLTGEPALARLRPGAKDPGRRAASLRDDRDELVAAEPVSASWLASVGGQAAAMDA